MHPLPMVSKVVMEHHHAMGILHKMSDFALILHRSKIVSSTNHSYLITLKHNAYHHHIYIYGYSFPLQSLYQVRKIYFIIDSRSTSGAHFVLTTSLHYIFFTELRSVGDVYICHPIQLTQGIMNGFYWFTMDVAHKAKAFFAYIHTTRPVLNWLKCYKHIVGYRNSNQATHRLCPMKYADSCVRFRLLLPYYQSVWSISPYSSWVLH